MIAAICEPLLKNAIAKRQELESFSVNDIQDLQRKETLLQEAEAALGWVKLVGDLLIGEALTQSGKAENLAAEALEVLKRLIEDALLTEDEEAQDRRLKLLREKADRMLDLGKPEKQPTRRAFHWALEFPEVFLQEDAPKGFAAIVGNPPFQGGSKITGVLGTDYRDFLVKNIADKRGNADLCAYFFLQAANLSSQVGGFGLVATNTIAQGDTREVGLDQLIERGYSIPRAVPSRPWSGTASLEVAYVWLCKQRWNNECVLDEKVVAGITAFLTSPNKVDGKPYQLLAILANAQKSFLGSKVYGQGFVMQPEEAQELIERDPKNKDVLFPYLDGEDLNSRPDQAPSRWVINFKDWALDAEHDDPKKPKGAPYTADYPDCLAIVLEKVKPERDKNNRKLRRERWWQYGERASSLYPSLVTLARVI